MAINASRYGRPQTIHVPAGSSHTAQRPSLGGGGMEDFAKMIKQLQDDSGNKEILRKAGFGDDVLDNMSSDNLEIGVHQLTLDKITRDEKVVSQERDGRILQNFLKTKKSVQAADQDRLDTPMEFQFGSNNINEGNEGIEGPLPSEDTVSMGTAGESINDPLSGADVMTRSLEQSEAQTAGGVQENPFFKRLLGLTGAPTSQTIEINKKIMNIETDQITGHKSVGIDPKDSKDRLFKPVPHPDDPTKLVHGIFNPRTPDDIVYQKENGKYVPFVKPAVAVNIGQKQKLKTLEDLKDENTLALENIRTFGQIAIDYDPSFMTSFGQNVKLDGSAFLDRLGVTNPLDPKFEFLQNATTFFQGVDQAFFVYRKFITGVAGGELEMKRIEDAFINRNQGPKAFKAALTRMQKLYQDTADISQKSIDFIEKNGWSLGRAQKYRAAQVEALLLRNGIKRKDGGAGKTKTSIFDSAVNSLSVNLGDDN